MAPGVGKRSLVTGYDASDAFLTFPSAISRRATTTSRFSESIKGLAPLKSRRARLAASITSSKRLGTLRRQSSIVIRDIAGIQTDFILRVKLGEILTQGAEKLFNPLKPFKPLGARVAGSN